jgi:hypothetical protein
MSRNISLEENDIVFVPRERLADATEFGKKVQMLVSIAILPLFGAVLIPQFFPGLKID